MQYNIFSNKVIEWRGSMSTPWLLCSLFLNIYLIITLYLDDQGTLSWTKKAGEEAEAVAAIPCSGHGMAYLDSLILDDGQPSCECNNCYGGPDCSQFTPGCAANAESGDPLFLEPFWLKHAASSALVISGWHRMSYKFNDQRRISAELERQIRKIHDIVGNADTAGKYIVFGAGSTQLLSAAVHALSHNSSNPAAVVASVPYYTLYEQQTEYFQNLQFNFQGDATEWKNNTDSDTTIIEFVTSPNNPDGQAMKPVLEGPNVKTIHDHAYYWPHFIAISAPANEDLMIFTLSKFTGHAGSRFGWALVKDEAIYERMSQYVKLNTLSISKDTQLRALKLIRVVLEMRKGREILDFGYSIMKDRWKKINSILSVSKRFSLQQIPPQYCKFSKLLREASPAYAWVKCERKEDGNCYEVLRAANIIGREGKAYGSKNRFVRLSLVKSQDDFDLLIHYLNILVSKEASAKVI